MGSIDPRSGEPVGAMVDRFLPISSSPRFLTSLNTARNAWNPSDGAMNSFHNLMDSGLTGNGRQQFRIMRDPNPSALALALLDYRLQNELTMTPEQRARRFVIVIDGVDNNGIQREMARAIDPGNVRQVLSLVSSIAGGSANRQDAAAGQPQMQIGNASEAFLESDPEAYEFSFLTNITSVTLRAVNPVETVDDEGNLAFDLPPAPIHYVGGPPTPALLPRRSSRIAARGSSGGAFFRYWLAETFPESLSFLQVYKKSETKLLVKNLSAKGAWTDADSFELSCLANSIILQDLPSSKFITLFEHTCSGGNPVFPTSRMGALAKALEIDICLSTYSPTHMTYGGHQKIFRGAERTEGGKIYYVGKVADHFIPDIESDWSRYAIRHFKKFKEMGGRPYCDLPLFRVKQLKGMKELKFPPFIQFITRGSGSFATYGEVLSVLLWGYTDGMDDYHQPPCVETMGVEDICLRAELYMYFQSMMKFYDLPSHALSRSELGDFVENNSRVIDKYRHSVLSFQPETTDIKKWGSFTNHPGNRIAFRSFSEQYEKEGGAKQVDEWMFPDRHMFKTTYVKKAEDGDVSYDPYCILLPFTMVAFDTETLSMSAEEADRIMKDMSQSFCHPSNNDYVAPVPFSPFPMRQFEMTDPDVSPSLVESVYNREGVCEWEGEGSEWDEVLARVRKETKKEEESVHVPYCASLCYYVDEVTNQPINFRIYPVETFGVGGSLVSHEGVSFKMVRKTFSGFTCMIQMCVFLGSSVFTDVSVHLIAHNARYDVNMMMKYSFAVIEDGIFRSTGRMNVCDLIIQAFPQGQGEGVEIPEEEESGRNKIYRRSNVWEHKKKIRVQCSLACTGIPLSAFGDTFAMGISKEYMPYAAYTRESLYHQHRESPGKGMIKLPPQEFFQAVVSIDKVWELTSAPSKEAFVESVRSAGALEVNNGGDLYMSLWRYARYYCEMDCEVLLVGFLSLRREMYAMKVLSPTCPAFISEEQSPCCKLLLENAVSLPQFASHYFGLNGVFEDVCEYKGLLMSFIRRGVCGGKTMLGANSPVMYDAAADDGIAQEAGEVDDMDAVNLYGTAMNNIAKDHGGFPRGKPKIWVPPGGKGTSTTFVPSFIQNAHYYFILISIKRLGRPLRFPIVNGPREIFPSSLKGISEEWQMGTDNFDSAEVLFEKLTRSANSSSRHFTNHPEGARMVVDKITFEDIIEFHHGADFEVYQALYWDEGGNDKIGAVMEYLFADRVKKQKEGKKAAAQARKLTMNSGYGRFLMAPVDSNYHFIEGKDNILRYVARHSCTTKEATFIRSDFAVVERRKGIQDFYNASPLGAMVLSVSKRIMNRVMVMYEDLYEASLLGSKFCMFYQDTDSIHLARKHIEPLFRAYTKKYGKKILVRVGEEETEYTISQKELGGFCTDFESVPGYSPPVSEVFIGVMKKVYVDCMTCAPLEETEGGKREVYHARMKGIPKKCVDAVALHGGMNLYMMYRMLFMGIPITFDLAKYSVRFEMGKDFSVSTNTSFKRVVQLNWESILLAHIEWVKSGWDYETFPYYESFLKLDNRMENLRSWGYFPLLKSVSWDAVKRRGKKNFFSSPVIPNVSGLSLVDNSNNLINFVTPASFTFSPAQSSPTSCIINAPRRTSYDSSKENGGGGSGGADSVPGDYDIDNYRSDNNAPLSSSGASFEKVCAMVTEAFPESPSYYEDPINLIDYDTLLHPSRGGRAAAAAINNNNPWEGFPTNFSTTPSSSMSDTTHHPSLFESFILDEEDTIIDASSSSSAFALSALSPIINPFSFTDDDDVTEDEEGGYDVHFNFTNSSICNVDPDPHFFIPSPNTKRKNDAKDRAEDEREKRRSRGGGGGGGDQPQR